MGADVDTDSRRETRGGFRNNKFHTTDSVHVELCLFMRYKEVRTCDHTISLIQFCFKSPSVQWTELLLPHPSTSNVDIPKKCAVKRLLMQGDRSSRDFVLVSKECRCQYENTFWQRRSNRENNLIYFSIFLLVLHRNSMWLIFISCNCIPHKVSYFKLQERNKKAGNVKHMCCELTKL